MNLHYAAPGDFDPDRPYHAYRVPGVALCGASLVRGWTDVMIRSFELDDRLPLLCPKCIQAASTEPRACNRCGRVTEVDRRGWCGPCRREYNREYARTHADQRRVWNRESARRCRARRAAEGAAG